MSNILTKLVDTVTLSPATPGTPGTPGREAYCVTTSSTSSGSTIQYVLVPADPNVLGSRDSYVAVTTYGAPVTTTSTVCYPAIAEVPPVPGVPATTREQFNLGWNAGARSIASIAGDGAAAFSAAEGVSGAVVGMYGQAPGYSFHEASHAFYFRDGLASVLELGIIKTGAVPYLPTDVFRIERAGLTVHYYKNTTRVYTSLDVSYGTQYLGAALYSGGDTVTDASLSVTMRVGNGFSGDTALTPLASRGGIVAGDGTATLGALGASGTGSAAQGGAATFAELGAVGSQGSYAAGTATLVPMTGSGGANSVRQYVRASATLGHIGSAAHGMTSAISLHPAKSLGDSNAGWPENVWAGTTVFITSGTGAGQSQTVAANSGQALLFNTAWVTVPNATSTYEIRDALGNVLTLGTVTPAGGAMRPLTARGSKGASSAGTASMLPLGAFGAPVVVLQGWAFLTGATGTLTARVRDSEGENAANVVAPTPTLRAHFGAFVTADAPTPTLSASGTGTNWLKASVEAPSGLLVASATVSGSSHASPRAPMASLVGYGGAVASVTLTGKATVEASVTSGAASAATVRGPMARLPLFEVTAEAYSRADILAPAGQMGGTLQAWIAPPTPTLVAIGTAVVAAAYEAYAVNLRHAPRGRGQEAPHDEVTRYTNFPFTHIVRHKNSYYGANSTGLYLLEGTTDAGAPVAYAARTALTDFGSPTRKTVTSAYFGGRLGAETTLTLHAGEGAQTAAYNHTTPRGALAQNHRQVFGRGIRQHRYYAIGIAGEGVMELDRLELNVHNSTRRI